MAGRRRQDRMFAASRRSAFLCGLVGSSAYLNPDERARTAKCSRHPALEAAVGPGHRSAACAYPVVLASSELLECLGPSKDGAGNRYMLPLAGQDQPVGSAVPLRLLVG